MPHWLFPTSARSQPRHTVRLMGLLLGVVALAAAAWLGAARPASATGLGAVTAAGEAQILGQTELNQDSQHDAGAGAQPQSDEPSDTEPDAAERLKSIEVADEPGEVRLTLEDGRSFRGVLVTRDEEQVTIRIAGIDTTFDAPEVTEMKALKPFEEVYESMRRQIAESDYESRRHLSEWAYVRDRLELAARELEALLDDFPKYEPARTLLRTVNLEIENRRNAVDDRQLRRSPAISDDPRFGPAALISDEEVNLIRVYETDLRHPPRLVIPRETVERLFDRYPESELLPTSEAGRREFHYKPADEILEVMFQLQARDLYREVRVLSEPLALNRFRLDVHRTWLINSCASNDCHGGAEAGELFLFNRRSNDARTVYTNLLILENTTIDGERLIDYSRPESSLLLRMGLPPHRTNRPHPAVAGWRPVFHDEQDPLFMKAVEWMRSMYMPRPDYPIEYIPPAMRDRDAALSAADDDDDEESTADSRERETRPVR